MNIQSRRRVFSVVAVLATTAFNCCLPKPLIGQTAWPPSGNVTATTTITNTNTCGPHGRSSRADYTSWTFTDSSGTAHQFSGGTFTISSTCGGTGSSSLNEWSNDGFYYLSATGGSGSITQQGGPIHPLYKVVSILYATPGNASSDSFTNGTTSASVTTIGSSFGRGESTTFSSGLLGFGANLQFGASTTNGMTSAFTETLAQAASISNASSASGPNTVSHNQDLILVWLNPQVYLAQTSSININYSIGTPSQQPPDILELTASTMQNNGGVTTVPLSLLQRQYDAKTGAYDLPGLAAVCKDQTKYVNNCSSGGQCGCLPSDFTGILATDPLLATTTASNPMTVDTSGIQACTDPSSASSCRYVPVPSTTGGVVQADTPLEGPQCAGCNRIVNSFTQTDSTATTKTLSESIATTVTYTYTAGFPLLPSFSSSNSFIWTDTESVGATNGSSNAIGYSLSSSTTSCSNEVLIYEDTLFHTFVTQLAPGNISCP